MNKMIGETIEKCIVADVEALTPNSTQKEIEEFQEELGACELPVYVRLAVLDQADTLEELQQLLRHAVSTYLDKQ
tara:strand:+ start:5982 stop:6206 length:225 start_codon:yes stop_codon:yes gene_type:complete